MGVGLVWPITVFIGSLPYWFGGVFVGPFVEGALTHRHHAWIRELVVRVDVRLHDLGRNGSLSFHEPELHSWDHPRLHQRTAPRSSPLALVNAMARWHGGRDVGHAGALPRIIGGGMALARAELTGTFPVATSPKVAADRHGAVGPLPSLDAR